MDAISKEAIKQAVSNPQHTLKVQDLTANARGKLLLQKLSFSINSGQVVGLLGPNGAGKSTCFKILIGLLSPLSGTIFLDDLDITSLSLHARAWKGLRYLPQESSVFQGLSVEENLMAMAELWYQEATLCRRRVDQLLNAFSLQGLRHANAARLSGGERRRTEIARALVGDPYFLLLDEPFAGVDPKTILEIITLIRTLAASLPLGFLITDHNIRDMFLLCDHLVVLHQGSVLCQGTPEALRKDPQLQRVYLGDYLLQAL